MYTTKIKQYLPIFAAFLVQALLYSCASVGYPTGGEVDKIPPKPVAFEPKNESRDFVADKILIQFDEYIQLKDVDNQVIISPPFENKPEIVVKGKAVQISIKDTLKPNTTYLFQFKNAVVDNNEGNALSSLDYVFSTGKILDSLSLQGVVVDALTLKPEENINVLLYNAADFTDSTVAKYKPVYLTKTDKKGEFKFKYLTQGSYKIIALKDNDKSLTYNNPAEKIAFMVDAVEPIYICDSASIVDTIELKAFEQNVLQQRITNSNLKKAGYAVITTSCPMQNPVVTSEGNDLIVYTNKTSDTLHVWAKKATDSLSLIVLDSSGISDTLKLRNFAKQKSRKEPFLKTNIKSTFPYYDTIRVSFTNPVESVIDSEKIMYVKTATDSFYTHLVFDSLKLNAFVSLKLIPDSSYQFIIIGKNIVDIYGNTNDTVVQKTKLNSAKDYGTIKITVVAPDKTLPYILQVLNEKGAVVSEKVVGNDVVEFTNLAPGKYTIRAIADDNANGKWDAGNYWKSIQSEKVYYMPKTLELRSNWDIEETFELVE